MYSLSVSEAIMLVRKNLDEQMDNYSALMEDIDSSELDMVIKKTLPESINEVHLAAPAEILDGETLSAEDYENGRFEIDEDGVLTFGTTKPFLRLIRFKANDSRYVINEVYPEVSPEGRMQENQYTRGTARNPRLIILQGKDKDMLSVFRYYSLSRFFSSPIDAIENFEYIPMYRYADETEEYRVAENVVEQVINRLTGKVLAIYGDQKAQYFLNNGMLGVAQPQPE